MNERSDLYRSILGGLSRDVRGTVQHVNSFAVGSAERFYTIAPAKVGELRGWVGHRRDWKWFFVAKGAFEVGLVRPLVWDAPKPDDRVSAIRLSSETPQIIEVPPRYYTAMRSLTLDAIMLVFSTGRIEDAGTDDYRLPVDFWRLESVGT